MKHKEQRVLVLFDVQNMYYSAKHLYNTKVNFKELLNEGVAGRKLVRAIAYVIKTEIKDEVNFHDALNKIGIEVKAKDLQIFIGGDKKGDWDIGIAMDAVRMQPKIDTLVLVSGDGDFKDLLAYMKSHGCRTEVIALGRTSSKRLKEEADDFFDLETNPRRFLINYRGKPVSNDGNKKQPPILQAKKPVLGKKQAIKTTRNRSGRPPLLKKSNENNPIAMPDEVQKDIMQANLEQIK
ncbi:NYN domain-containing protein [Candidatus Woesearchaeota archaeon]|nr:NYN domain-containing protein [Candidatus Woesearchaeota archaeon]